MWGQSGTSGNNKRLEAIY
ncbi:MAG: hypothetical protein IJZ16_09795 [Clostridia bacterium]|nr:hypothetical protein [Bacteroidaceae bacterium]MBQ8767083.1 hypothetical protein [Clostridia bacterium]